MSSPKLRVKLSPAKLDKLLLELYDSVTDGPSGDVFRVIGGGLNVGKQNLYLKQQQLKNAKTTYHEDFSDDSENITPVTLVKRALSRNFPAKWRQDVDDDTLTSASKVNSSVGERQKQAPKMSLVKKSTPQMNLSMQVIHRGSFAPYRPSMRSYSPLI
jgi:hypothetical protein